jgi:hypothetical protein
VCSGGAGERASFGVEYFFRGRRWAPLTSGPPAHGAQVDGRIRGADPMQRKHGKGPEELLSVMDRAREPNKTRKLVMMFRSAVAP